MPVWPSNMGPIARPAKIPHSLGGCGSSGALTMKAMITNATRHAP